MKPDHEKRARGIVETCCPNASRRDDAPWVPHLRMEITQALRESYEAAERKGFVAGLEACHVLAGDTVDALKIAALGHGEAGEYDLQRAATDEARGAGRVAARIRAIKTKEGGA